MPQVDPVYICWLLIGKPLHSSLQGGFWHKYRSYAGVIVCWNNNIFFPLDLLLLITQDKYELSSNHLFILSILKNNSETLLTQHWLNTSKRILPQPSTSPCPCLLRNFPYLGCHYWTHLDIILAPPLIFFLLHIFANRWVHSSCGVCRGYVLGVII